MRLLAIALCLFLNSSFAFAKIDMSSCQLNLADYIKRHQAQLDFQAKIEQEELQKIKQLLNNITSTKLQLEQLERGKNPAHGKDIAVVRETLTNTLKANEQEVAQLQASIGRYADKERLSQFKNNPQAFQKKECETVKQIKCPNC